METVKVKYNSIFNILKTCSYGFLIISLIDEFMDANLKFRQLRLERAAPVERYNQYRSNNSTFA